MVWVNIDGDERRDRVFIDTLRPIRAGEELSFDYALGLSHEMAATDRERWRCRCGAVQCRGSLLRA